MYSKKNIVFISVLWSLIGAGLYFLDGIIWISEWLLSVIFYFFIYFIIRYLWSKIRKKDAPVVAELWIWFLKSVGLLIIISTSMIGGFSYYHNEVAPANMPEYTLSNGEKTIVFQTMSHIGSPEFYQQIQENIRSVKEENFVYFYEWVKPGTPENTQAFHQAIGIEFDAELYKNFSQLYGVVAQDNRIFLWLINNNDYNIDLSLDQIMERYREISSEETYSAVPVDINSEILSTLSQLRENQLRVLRYINRGILNFMIKSENIQQLLTDTFSNPELFWVILDDRNRVLADAIILSEEDNIYVTYGLLHFKGVLELLQKNDPNWSIISQKDLSPIR